jgi:DNA polymerase-3 subunit gamma/tau
MNDATTPQRSSDAGLFGAEPEGAAYRVLARKYRPSNFDDLIGQEAMVRTISNAFETGRIPQAWILTGVRGVGKTTTARILARALNYQLPDGSVPGPTIKMPTLGTNCQAIMDSRHIDVLEMDAASHNGVDDVRQLTDASRYAPVSARYKVYILDEVHMLSTAAFNALLKTLEEPPAHVKFIFATTEIRKVPVTVLSRCQRFDLRRIETGVMVKHLEGIAAKENLEAETEALALVARAAEGSVRDALSLFDQAIAHAAGSVRAKDIREMLGLADRTRVIDLFEALMKGDMARALEELRSQYDSGADPATVMADLAEFTHFVTRVKIVPAVADDISLSEAERTRGRAFATALSMRVLSRTWQMLLKGAAEVKDASRPIAAAEMVLVRIAYAADLPTPDEVIRDIQSGGTPSPGNGSTAAAPKAAPPRPSAPISSAPISSTPMSSTPMSSTPMSSTPMSSTPMSSTLTSSAPVSAAPVPQAPAPRSEAPRGAPRAALAPAPQPATDPVAAEAVLAVGTFEEIVAIAADKRDLQMKSALERDMRLVRCEDGRLEIALEPGAQKTVVNELSRKLKMWTGRQWLVSVSNEAGAPTLKSQADARQAELETGVRADPLVKAVLERWPGSEITSVRGPKDAPAELPPSVSGDVLPPGDDEGFGENWVRDDGVE